MRFRLTLLSIALGGASGALARYGAIQLTTRLAPSAAFPYATLGVKGSLEFSAKVLEQAHVALVPGEAFGADANVRLSFATSMEQIQKGLDRLDTLLGKA